jgi:hypothetical protein
MRFLAGVTSVLALSSGLALGAPSPSKKPKPNTKDPKTIDDFQALAIQSLREGEARKPKGRPGKNGCTLKNARVRRDW